MPQSVFARRVPGDIVINRVLQDPYVRSTIANPKFTRNFDVPYGAGPNKTKDGVVNIDRHIPQVDVVNGRRYDPARPTAVHEIVEQYIADQLQEGHAHAGDQIYEMAHHAAERAERMWVEKHLGPTAWNTYQQHWAQWLAPIEHSNPQNPPPNLDKYPYPHRNVHDAPQTQETEPVFARAERRIGVAPAPKFQEGGPVPATEAPDYDYSAWQQANPGVNMAPGQHYPDTYKLPNHPTFSDESLYHARNGAEGGHWKIRGLDTWAFTPGRTNLEQRTPEQLADYFKRNEVGNVLDLPGYQAGGEVEEEEPERMVAAPTLLQTSGTGAATSAAPPSLDVPEMLRKAGWKMVPSEAPSTPTSTPSSASEILRKAGWRQVPTEEDEGAAGTVLRETAHEAVPLAAGIGTAALTGAGLGALGAGPIGGFVGAIGGGIAGGIAASGLQEWALKKLGLSDEEQRAVNREAHPYAALAGEAALPALFGRPSAFWKAGAAGTRLMESPRVQAAAGALLGGGLEAGQEAISGQDFDPKQIAAQAASMGVFSGAPTRLGRALMGPAAAAGERLGTRLGGRPGEAVATEEAADTGAGPSKTQGTASEAVEPVDGKNAGRIDQDYGKKARDYGARTEQVQQAGEVAPDVRAAMAAAQPTEPSTARTPLQEELQPGEAIRPGAGAVPGMAQSDQFRPAAEPPVQPIGTAQTTVNVNGQPRPDLEARINQAAAEARAAPPPEQGMPSMITNSMRALLRAMGHSDEDIRNMTPPQAWEILRARPAEPPPAAAAAARAPDEGIKRPRPGAGKVKEALWRGQEYDLPVQIVDEPPRAGPDGRMYQKVIHEGKETFAPADELVARPSKTKPAAAAAAEPEIQIGTKPTDVERAAIRGLNQGKQLKAKADALGMEPIELRKQTRDALPKTGDSDETLRTKQETLQRLWGEAPAAQQVEPTAVTRDYAGKLDPNISAADYAQRMSELRDNKPRPIEKLWRNPDKAPREQVAAAKEAIKAWNREYSAVSKNQKLALERDNAAFRAQQAEPTAAVKAGERGQIEAEAARYGGSEQAAEAIKGRIEERVTQIERGTIPERELPPERMGRVETLGMARGPRRQMPLGAQPPLGAGGAGAGAPPPRRPMPPGAQPPLPPGGGGAAPGTPPTVAAAQSAILGRVAQKPSWLSRIPTSWGEAKALWREFYTNAKNDLDPLEQLEKQGPPLTPQESFYTLARLTRGLASRVHQQLELGTYDIKTGQKNGISLDEAIKPIANDPEGFTAYALGKHAIELEARGVNTGMPMPEVNVMVAARAKEFEPVLRELVGFQDRVLNNMTDIVGAKGIQAMRALNKSYVPFYRMLDPKSELGQQLGVGRDLKVRDPIYAIKGSDRPVIDPIDSIVKNTYLFTSLAERNRVLQALEKWDLSRPEGSRFLTRSKDVHPITVTPEEINRFMKQYGIPPTATDAMTIFRPDLFNPSDNKIRVFNDGKAKIYDAPPAVARAINGMNRDSLNMLTRILATPARMLRAGQVLGPEFMLRNPIRDQFSAMAFSKYGYVPVYDMVRGLGELLNKQKTADYQNWLINGGANANLVSMDRPYISQNPKDFIGKVKNVVTHPLEALRMISELLEDSTRMGLYKRAIEGGAHPIEAAFLSREGTLDFARIGAKTQAINSIIPFFNAQVEGVDRAARAFRDNKTRFLATVGMSITVPSVLLWLANKDDPRWKELPEWQKDLFWIIPTNKWVDMNPADAGKVGAAYKRQLPNGQWQRNDGTIWRIPKPFELGVLFGSVPERVLDAFFTDNPHAFKDLHKSVGQALFPGFLPQAAAPLIEQFANRSMFLDRPLVPKYLEGMQPQYQALPYTSETAKAIGNLISNIPGAGSFASPAIIDNYIRQWSGGLGQHVTSILDKSLQASGVTPPKVDPTPTLADMPGIKAFVARFPSASVQSVQDFYDTYDERKKAKTTADYMQKHGQPQTAQMLRENYSVQTAEPIHKALGNQFKAVRNIYEDPKMTPDDKRQAIDLIYMQAMEIAKRGNALFDRTRRTNP